MRIEELKVLSECMVAISRIYGRVIRCVHMADKNSYYLNNTIVVKQGHPFSPTQIGLCIDEIERVVTDFIMEEII